MIQMQKKIVARLTNKRNGLETSDNESTSPNILGRFTDKYSETRKRLTWKLGR